MSRADERSTDRAEEAADRGSSPEGNPVGRVIVAVVLFGIVAAMVWMAQDFGTEARRLPLVVGYPLLVAASLNLVVEVIQVRRLRRGSGEVPTSGPSFSAQVEQLREKVGASDEEDATAEAPVPAGAGGGDDDGLPIFGALGILAALVVLYLAFGQFWVAPLFVILVMRIIGRQPWRTVAIATVFLTVVMYLLTNVMGVQAHQGWLVDRFGWLDVL